MDLPGLIQVLANVAQILSLLVAIVSLVLTVKAGRSGSSSRGKHRLLPYIFTAALAFLIGTLLPKPDSFLPWPLQSTSRVAIATPELCQLIAVSRSEDGGSFWVSGSSSGLKAEQIYVLVHSIDPPDDTWWIQEIPVTPDVDGHWVTEAWIGSRASPPEVGHTLEIAAVAVQPEAVKDHRSVSSIEELSPIARSDTVRLVIGSVTGSSPTQSSYP